MKTELIFFDSIENSKKGTERGLIAFLSLAIFDLIWFSLILFDLIWPYLILFDLI